MAKETIVKAICTWGEAEDVTIVGKHTNKWVDRFKTGLMLMLAEPIKNLFPDRPPSPGKLSVPVHGMSDDWHLSMTKEEARDLGDQLHRAAAHAEELDAGYRDEIEKEFERKEAEGDW